VAAVAARSVALAGFGLDSLIEISASTVVLWELSGSGQDRQRRALRLIGGAFLALAAYLTIQSVLVLVTGYRPGLPRACPATLPRSADWAFDQVVRPVPRGGVVRAAAEPLRLAA